MESPEKAKAELKKRYSQTLYYYEAGQLQKAVREIRVASRIAKQVSPPFFYAMVLGWQGKIEFYLGRLKQAEAAFRQVLALGLDESEYGVVVALALHLLGQLCHQTGRLQEAEQHLQSSIAAYSRHGGNAVHVDSNNALAMLWRSQGRYREAVDLLEGIVDVVRRTNNLDLAITLNNLALLRADLNQWAEALRYMEEAVTVVQNVSGPDRYEYARLLCNKAALLSDMGHSRQAEPLLREAVSILDRTEGERSRGYIAAMRAWARVTMDLGEVRIAGMRFRYAVALAEEFLGENDLQTAECWAGLGVYSLTTGDYGQAQAFLRQAVDLAERQLGKDNPTYALYVLYLAELYTQVRHNDKALALLLGIEPVVRATAGQDSAHYARVLDGLASVYDNMNAFSEAEECFLKALSIWRRISPDHPELAVLQHDLAYMYYRAGRYTEAEAAHRESLALTRRVEGDNHLDMAAGLTNLSLVLAATGRAGEALDMLEQAVAFENRIIGDVFAGGGDSERMAFLALLEWRRDVFLSLVWRYLSDRPDAVRSATELVLRRKAIGAEALGVQRDAVLGGRYPDLAKDLAELHALRFRLVQLQLQGPGPDGMEAHEAQIRHGQAEVSRMETELAWRVPELNLSRSLEGVSLAGVTAAVPADAMLVEFMKFTVYDFETLAAEASQEPRHGRYVAFVFPAGQPDGLGMVDVGDAAQIEELIAAWRASVTSAGERGLGHPHRPRPGEADLGDQLRRKLVDPLLAGLEPRRRLLLSPDGELASLPFEALPDGRGGYLIDGWSISYLSAGRDLMRPQEERRNQPGAPLVVADPDFTLQGSGEEPAERPSGERAVSELQGLSFDRLPGTRLEGDRIARVLGVQPFMGALALESQIKAHRSPLILHLATHGFFLSARAASTDAGVNRRASRRQGFASVAAGLRNPLLRSGLALAGANTWLGGGALPPEAEDGLLTAEDVTGLDLLDTELVVLSACETGLGEVRAGEGVFGLRRAFVIAGARTVVMSLWKVGDLSTAILMDRFYRNLLAERMPRAEALREAQRYLRSLRREEALRLWPAMDSQQVGQGEYPFAHPFHWGAFICQGETGFLPARGDRCGQD